MKDNIDHASVSKAAAHPEDAQKILEELHEQLEAAREEYVETADAYWSSYQQEHDDALLRVLSARKARREGQRQLKQAEALLEKAETAGWPEVISACSNRTEELRKELDELDAQEQELLAHQIEGDPDLFEETKLRAQALEYQEHRERETRFAIAGIIDNELEKQRRAFYQDPTDALEEKLEELRELQKIADHGIPQEVFVPPELTFYLLNKRKGRPLEGWKRSTTGLHELMKREQSGHEKQ